METPSADVHVEGERLWAQVQAAMSGDRWDEAEAVLRDMVGRWPRHRPALHNLAVAVQRRGEATEAEALYRRSLALDPNCHVTRYGLSRALAIQGRHTEAHPYLLSRFHVAETKIRKLGYPRPEWRGEDLAGKRIAVFPEQGLGDQIQMARFARTLRDRGAEVTWLCHPSLSDLFARSLPATVVPASGAAQFTAPDYWTTISDLPGLLQLDGEAVASAPYLEGQGASHAGGVGLVTRGRPTHNNDRNRSLSAEDADRLRAMLGDPVSLHPEDTGAKDFAQTADIIAGLDLVVTVDTSVAHLAGAMGKPVWILVPAINTDWRWARGSSQTPWYASATLFRSAQDGDWRLAMDDIASALAAR